MTHNYFHKQALKLHSSTFAPLFFIVTPSQPSLHVHHDYMKKKPKQEMGGPLVRHELLTTKKLESHQQAGQIF